jgi:hypothetical protein
MHRECLAGHPPAEPDNDAYLSVFMRIGESRHFTANYETDAAVCIRKLQPRFCPDGTESFVP